MTFCRITRADHWQAWPKQLMVGSNSTDKGQISEIGQSQHKVSCDYRFSRNSVFSSIEFQEQRVVKVKDDTVPCEQLFLPSMQGTNYCVTVTYTWIGDR